MSQCPLCMSFDAKILFESRLGVGVRSDLTTLYANSRIEFCAACGHLFKPSELVRRCSDYENYRFSNNSGGKDKIEFLSNGGLSRSTLIKDFLQQHGLLSSSSKLLDFGCNGGAFLAAINGKENGGFDVSEHYRPLEIGRAHV